MRCNSSSQRAEPSPPRARPGPPRGPKVYSLHAAEGRMHRQTQGAQTYKIEAIKIAAANKLKSSIRSQSWSLADGPGPR